MDLRVSPPFGSVERGRVRVRLSGNMGGFRFLSNMKRKESG